MALQIDPQLIAEKTLRILLIIAGARIAKKLANKVFHRNLHKIDHDITKELKKERIKTLSSVLSNFASFIIGIAAIMIILSEVGVDIAPLIAGLGILGLGVGFASQTLIRDYISGFFILFENQYNVGDKVEVGGAKGEVKELSLRTTVLQDEERRIHIIPNSKITTVTKEGTS